MKRLRFLIFVCCGYLLLAAQDAQTFYAKYPRMPSDLCTNCTIEVNPYFSTITDEKLGQSVVTYFNYTSEKEAEVVKLNVSESERKWQAYPGDPNETKFYKDINKGITDASMKYAKGHYAAFKLCAWTQEGAVMSCTYKINEGIENQGQNQGTELEVENMTRALVGSNSSEVKRVKYSGPIYQRVDCWKGSWGSKKLITMDGITRNYSSIYWNLISYGTENHAYWFPNDTSASSGYKNFEIPVDTLVQRLRFNPIEVFPATAN